MSTISFELNGKPVAPEVDSEMPLLWYLRDYAGLTGTKYGCGIAQCGACTVHVNGAATRACVTPLARTVHRLRLARNSKVRSKAPLSTAAIDALKCVTPVFSMRAMSRRSVASSPTSARSPGPFSPSRSSIAR